MASGSIGWVANSPTGPSSAWPRAPASDWRPSLDRLREGPPAAIVERVSVAWMAGDRDVRTVRRPERRPPRRLTRPQSATAGQDWWAIPVRYERGPSFRRRWTRSLPPRSCPRCIAPSSTASPSSMPPDQRSVGYRVRVEATRIYSRAWDERARRRPGGAAAPGRRQAETVRREPVRANAPTECAGRLTAAAAAGA